MLSEKVTEIPYARSSRMIEKITGVKVSGKGIWHLVQRKRFEERAVHEVERKWIFEDARDSYPQDWQRGNNQRAPLYIELDGTMVASRESGEERFEVKGGIMYRDIRQVGKKRYRLMDKVVCQKSAEYSVACNGDEKRRAVSKEVIVFWKCCRCDRRVCLLLYDANSSFTRQGLSKSSGETLK